MKVSIIVPIYNSKNTLEKCLDSILNQTYSKIEVICINDGSNDSSLDVLNKYSKKDKRIIIINQKKNKGVAYTKNHGIKLATGDYISFVDSDDYIELNMIEKMLSLAKNQKLDIVKCHYNNYINGKLCNDVLDYENNFIIKSNQNKNIFINSLIDGKIPGYLPLIMINSNLIRNNKIFIDENLNFLEDLLFYIKLVNVSKKIGIINENLYNYINNSNGLTCSLNIKKIENRIDGIIYCNKEIKKMGILDNTQEIMLDTRSTYMLIHSFMEQYRTNDKNILVHINDSINIFRNANINNLDRFTKRVLEFIINENYNKLFLLFKITTIYLKIKG